MKVVVALLVVVALGTVSARLPSHPVKGHLSDGPVSVVSTLVNSFIDALQKFLGGSEGDSGTDLSNWMGSIEPILRNQPFLDISVPGTHDTFTYDLEGIVADGGLDESEAIVKILQTVPKIFLPKDWIKRLGRSQNLHIENQLDNGVRFIDFRIMYTDGAWRSLHFAQTETHVETFCQTIRDWLDKHPQEIVTLWLSRHGDESQLEGQYPHVSDDRLHAIWAEMQRIFAGLIVNHNESPLATTTYGQLLEKNQRVVIYAADYDRFTGGGTPFALDSRQIDNALSGTVYKPVSRYAQQIKYFSTLTERKANNKSQGKYSLYSMAQAMKDEHIEYRAWIHWWPITREKNRKKCAQELFPEIPGNQFCPNDLIRHNTLGNYYLQKSFEDITAAEYEYPNAIYLDVLDNDGTIRTDARDFEEAPAGTATRYQYAAHVILANVRRACKNGAPELKAECDRATHGLQELRNRFPMALWNDPANGRIPNLPIPPVNKKDNKLIVGPGPLPPADKWPKTREEAKAAGMDPDTIAWDLE